MNKWLKKIFPSKNSMKKSAVIKKLKPYLKHSCYLARDKQAIARGVSAGLAGCVLPGFQILYWAILVILLRGNLAVALLCTLITNPFTATPIAYFIYSVGSIIIGNGESNIVHKNFVWDFSSVHSFWFNASGWALQFGKAFLVGLPIVSLCLGIIGYFGTLLIWMLYERVFRRK